MFAFGIVPAKIFFKLSVVPEKNASIKYTIVASKDPNFFPKSHV